MPAPSYQQPRSAKVTDTCGSHPEGRDHECLRTEMRCAYCGERLAPYPCNGCGRFLTAGQMHAASADGESWRCDRCS
jgi:DNA-directed RNA polymerase subunit RPC12/RpoP